MPDVPFTPEEVRKRYGKIIPAALIVSAAVLLLAGWGLYVAKTGFGVNIVGMDAGRAKELKASSNSVVELVLAVLASAVAPYLLLKAASVRRLALHGHETVGRIVRTSALSKGGSTPVKIEYMVAGSVYGTKKDYPSDLSEEGREVRVIYDPKKPSRCLVI